MELSFGENGILAPAKYWVLTASEKAAIVNGCGTAGWKGRLVPDEIAGIPFNPACDPHDCMYVWGKTDDDKKDADRVLLYNLLVCVDNHHAAGFIDELEHEAARRAAWAYYLAVHDGGQEAFDNAH